MSRRIIKSFPLRLFFSCKKPSCEKGGGGGRRALPLTEHLRWSGPEMGMSYMIFFYAFHHPHKAGYYLSSYMGIRRLRQVD